ncbi:hypothetical protein CDD83_6140 [Cordyceps sp. RAO-2017]|nr:hypothetical protein CDD83_6140 [Cordyceps sp. RAO-2017]
MARTRSTKANPADSKAPPTPSACSKITLSASTGPPPRLFVLPKSATAEARIVLLPNPRHGRPARYLVCPESGMYEFIKVAAPKSAPKSWLIETRGELSGEEIPSGDATQMGAQVVMDADMFMATHIDPLFLVLPALADDKASKESDEKRRLFLSSDDWLDKLPQESSHLCEILRWPHTRALIEKRMAAVCDSVEAGDEAMFRLSEDKLLKAIFDKAKKLSEGGLPPSMEDKFVKRVLETPVLLSKRDAEGSLTANEKAASPTASAQTEPTDSQSTAAPNGVASTSPSQTATLPTEDKADDGFASSTETPPGVLNLQRLRVAFDFICSSYLSPHLAERLQRALKASSYADFAPLDEYLATVARLRAEAVELSSFADFSRKRSRDEEDDEARAEKKRALEDEKKRKANQSRGVRELKKVNTSGMMKLSAFFKSK